MKKYAQTRILGLVAKLSAEAKRASEDANDEAVHDLRVAIRRLSRGLRAFAPFLPEKSWKEIRRALSGLMRLAADVRDRDIARELLGKAGMNANARVMGKLGKDRGAAAGALRHALQDWITRDAARQWKGALEL